MSTIPESHFVSMNPSVISAGGAALDMNALVLTKSGRVPIGAVQPFPTAPAVSNYFGPGSAEASFATIYFNGFNGSTKKPGNILFAQKNSGNVAAYLRGANVSGLTLAQLQALTGVLTITADGTPKTSGTINLSGATSFSNAATIILAAFTSPNFTVTYDSISGGFLFTSSSTGSSSSMLYATGSLSTASNLALTQSAGAVLSQGANPASNETAFMNAIVAKTQNWVTFSTVYDPDAGSGNTTKLNFAAWVNAQANRYAYVSWDPDASPTTTVPATTSMGYVLAQANSSGTALVYGADLTKAAFICGIAASLDWGRKNGRKNFAYLSQSGLVPDVTDITTATNLEANGYNYYGITGSPNPANVYQFLFPGSISGVYKWIASYIGQIKLNTDCQTALLAFLTQIGRVPYNDAGYALIRSALMDPINAALNFGTITKGVTLSSAEAAEVNNAAGVDIDSTLSAQGFYLQILDPGAVVRAAQGSPIVTLFYTDGESVNTINVASVEVQ